MHVHLGPSRPWTASKPWLRSSWLLGAAAVIDYSDSHVQAQHRSAALLAALEQSNSPLIQLKRRPPSALSVSVFALQEGAELDVISPWAGR